MKFVWFGNKVLICCSIGLSLCLNAAIAAGNQRQAGASAPGTVKLQVPPAPKTVNSANDSAKKKNNSQTINVSLKMSEQFVLQSRDISSPGKKWQSFSDYLTVQPASSKLPYFVTVVNGTTAANRFQDVRVYLGRTLIATVKDFNTQGVLSRDISKFLSSGQNLLTVQCVGPAGAKLNWKFTTPKLIISKVSPKEIGPTDKITIDGNNFSDTIAVNQVFIEDRPATVVSAKAKSLQVKLPNNVIGGKTKLYVVVGSQRSAPIDITIKAAPSIEGVDMVSTAPGQPLQITGKGFSPVASENAVMVGAYPAQVVAASPTSLDIIVPLGLDAQCPSWDVPITVKTNGMDSVDPYHAGRINIQQRVY